jgi:hypothetical protein
VSSRPFDDLKASKKKMDIAFGSAAQLKAAVGVISRFLVGGQNGVPMDGALRSSN